ncbi:FAD-dependent thymidylate synthase [Thermoflavimicrobium dichotomicum]|uniref:Thymidylate synthase, flavin-dependent n=1 Tax=Thermoflavimicrobium dichotomicum TaxID=46223 RepID=A0A1I3LU77_9BACL|nr:FAD-dependent thymidylate synthase [Thermoflavimicrobium dichotomicum]SFI88328.1 thymidylate synthase, flavin-dependent [Thermoflavimicrobium dichotomicum]
MKPAIDLTRYVSNLDKNVYAIFNLPEEVIAVIFAYVSRSPASFRENLAKLLADSELATNLHSSNSATAYSKKAARFHEKWVVGYGHSSVAEHAVAHIGIEKISRLASAELELANTFNSFTEYSQRYQRPKRGDFYIPQELEQAPELKKAYIQFNEKAYDIYEDIMAGLTRYLLQTIPKEENESDQRFQLRVEKIAFEDARYVLPLATLTNLGMTGNGRALRDTLVRLLSSAYTECHHLAHELEQEISKVIPTLLKYVKPNEYLIETRKKLQQQFQQVLPTGTANTTGPQARFIHMPDYRTVLTQLATYLLLTEHPYSLEEAEVIAQQYSMEELEQIATHSLSALRFFDNPVDELGHLTYRFECKISEANWHQLLRHNRKTHFTYTKPTTRLGYTIPPHIREAGLTSVFVALMEEAEQIVHQIESFEPTIAAYAVTNAHHRQVVATVSLWELYHLINLRTSPEAQWDIRHTFNQIYQVLKDQHPVLAQFAKRRQ